jgi:hypothetical protein
MIEFTQDKCDLLNNYAGETVNTINLRGREWVSPQRELNISIVFKVEN